MNTGDTRQLGGHTIRVLYNEQEIAERVEALAAEIAAANFQDLLVVAVLKGSFIFAADLLRALHKQDVRLEMDFMMLASYGKNLESSGQVQILRDIESSVRDRPVILIDDILESGRTVAFAKDLIVARGAAEVKTCVFLDKPGKRAANIDADYLGFSTPDLFVVGYGMDMAHSFRELPYVGVVEV